METQDQKAMSLRQATQHTTHTAGRSVLASSMLLALGLAAIAMSPAQAAPEGRLVQLADCSAAAVQTALNDAIEGDIIQMPAGTCDWGNVRVGNYDNGTHPERHPESVWLRGAGKGLTVIKRSNPTEGDNSVALSLKCYESQQTRLEISDFTMQGICSQNLAEHGQCTWTPAVSDSGLTLGGCVDFKIHDMHFDRYSGFGIAVEGDISQGVIYNSTFTDNYRSGSGYGVSVSGDDDGIRGGLDLGSAHAVFVEDSVFSGNRHSIASNYGSRYVFRHNSVSANDDNATTGQIDSHGLQVSDSHPPKEGSRSYEIYENHLTFIGDLQPHLPMDNRPRGISIRGGDGVIFNNLIDYQGTTDYGFRYTVRFVVEDDGCADVEDGPVQGPAGPRPARDQTVEAWIWGNVNHRPGTSDSSEWIDLTDWTDGGDFDCNYYFREGADPSSNDSEYHLGPKPGYVPYPYPHPLRGDVIFRNGFEASGA